MKRCTGETGANREDTLSKSVRTIGGGESYRSKAVWGAKVN